MKIRLVIRFALLMPSFLTAFSGDHLHQFMWANFDCFNNQSERALSRYQKIKGHSVWTYHGYIPFLFKHEQYDEIVKHATTVDTHFKNSPSLQYLLALSFKRTGQTAACNQRMVILNRQYPDHSEIALQAAQAHLESNQQPEALAVIETYLNKTAHMNNAFLFHFLKAQIYNQMNDTPNALKNIDLCLTNRPSYSNAWLMKASLEEKQGSLPQAIEGYSRFLNLSDTMNSTIQNHLTNLMVRQSSTPETPAVHTTEKGSSLDNAIASFARNNSNEALTHVNKHLQEEPESVQAKLLRIQNYMKNNKHDQAIDAVQKEIAKDPENGLWYKTLYLLKNRGIKAKKIIQLFKDLTKQHPKSIHPCLYTADMLLRSTHPTDALVYLKKAASLTPIAQQKALILYQQAVILYEKKDFKQLDETMAKIIQYDDQFFPAYNLQAYSLAKRNSSFARAHELIAIALKHDPDNQHYRDTKGYIFYKEGHYTEAEKIFEELCIPCHTDTMITKHLAKTYHKQNKHEKAALLSKKIALGTQKEHATSFEKKT